MIAATTNASINPFPGLRPFREDEEHLFFGREHQVDAMVDKLAEKRFLAVVGTSGSGKSSLVNCGLRPALRQGLMASAGTAWRMAQFRPGSDPIGAMARALAQDGVLFSSYAAEGLSLAEIIETTLRMSKLGLIDIFEQAALGEGVNLLVVVDQFEELFRYRQLGAAGDRGGYSIGEQAAAFVNLLLEVKDRASCQIFVVLTMRSDFLGDCTQFLGLAEAINAGQYLVPRMTRDERRAAIECPVKVGGAEIAPVLLTRLVNDVGDNPDQLSILQHALNRTWARWWSEGGKGPLDLKHYEAIGTMAHALDQHAEKTYAELGSAGRLQICEKLFKALTDRATDPRGVRRPTTLGMLCALTDAAVAEVTEVIDGFRKPSRSFLMPPAGDVLTEGTVIDISHESLMRVWERLERWAEEEAQSARAYCRLADTAALHATGNASLWRDPELQLALDWRDRNQPTETWAARYHAGFTAAMRFLTESSEAREVEQMERRQQRRRQHVMVFGVVLVGLGCVASLFASQFYALPQTSKSWIRALEATTSGETQKQNLRRLAWFQPWLPPYDFSGVRTLSKISYPDLKLNAPNFSRVEFTEINLPNAQLGSASFAGSLFRRNEFSGAKLKFAQYGQAEIRRTSFANADLYRAVFDRAMLCGVDFSNADIQDASFWGATLDDRTYSSLRKTVWWIATGWNRGDFDKLLGPQNEDESDMKSESAGYSPAITAEAQAVRQALRKSEHFREEFERPLAETAPGSFGRAMALNRMAWTLSRWGIDGDRLKETPVTCDTKADAKDPLDAASEAICIIEDLKRNASKGKERDGYDFILSNFHDTQAYILMQMGRMEEAKALYENDIGRTEADAGSLFRYAITLFSVGTEAEATKRFEEAIKAKNYVPSDELLNLRKRIPEHVKEMAYDAIDKAYPVPQPARSCAAMANLD